MYVPSSRVTDVERRFWIRSNWSSMINTFCSARLETVQERKRRICWFHTYRMKTPTSTSVSFQKSFFIWYMHVLCPKRLIYFANTIKISLPLVILLGTTDERLASSLETVSISFFAFDLSPVCSCDNPTYSCFSNIRTYVQLRFQRLLMTAAYIT